MIFTILCSFFFSLSPLQLLAQTLDKQSREPGYLMLCILERQPQIFDCVALTVTKTQSMKLLGLSSKGTGKEGAKVRIICNRWVKGMRDKGSVEKTSPRNLHWSGRVARMSDKLYHVGFLPRQDAPFAVGAAH